MGPKGPFNQKSKNIFSKTISLRRVFSEVTNELHAKKSENSNERLREKNSKNGQTDGGYLISPLLCGSKKQWSFLN